MFGLFIDYSERKYCYAHESLSVAKYHIDKCQNCGRNIIRELSTIQESEFILDGGKQYTDFLFYGGGGLYFLISNRVLDAFIEHGITGYDQVSEVSLYRERKNALVKQDVSYYSANITGSIDFDLKAMALKRKNRCSYCNQFDWSRQRLAIIKTVFDMDTWDKSDLCRITSFPGHIVCTEKVKDIVEEYQFSGVVFQREDSIFRIP